MKSSRDPSDLTGHPPSGRAPGASDVWLSAITLWYLSGLLAALGFSLGFYLLRPATGRTPESRDVLDAFTWMDGKWYKQIAVEGYHYAPHSRSNVAFFPVYPLLARGLVAITGMRVETALLIVSNGSLLAALAMLGLYVRARYRQAPAELADYALLSAALFPTGCFFRLAYSESTCLLLLILAMYAMLRRWPPWSIALVVGLATAARPVGLALLAPFAVHLFRRGRRQPDAPARQPADRGATATVAPTRLPPSFGLSFPPSLHRSFPPSLHLCFPPSLRLSFPLSLLGRFVLYLPLACWGLAVFLAYQYYAFGDPLAVFKAHDQWRIRDAVDWPEKALALATLEPIRSVYDSRSPAFWAGSDTHGVPWFSLQFANPLFFLGAAALSAVGFWRRWLSLEEASLAALLLLIPYGTRAHEMGMGSMGRFVAIVFPIYLALAQLLARLPGPLRAALLASSGIFLAVYTALYTAGYVVF